MLLVLLNQLLSLLPPVVRVGALVDARLTCRGAVLAGVRLRQEKAGRQEIRERVETGVGARAAHSVQTGVAMVEKGHGGTFG